VLLLALGSVGFECGSPVNANTGFDLWCGDALCGWSVDKGDVERVSTWHERDYAALLIGPEVELTQVVVPDTGPCGGLGLGFEDGTTPHDLDVRLLGSAEPGTTVSFEADDDEDGAADGALHQRPARVDRQLGLRERLGVEGDPAELVGVVILEEAGHGARRG